MDSCFYFGSNVSIHIKSFLCLQMTFIRELIKHAIVFSLNINIGKECKRIVLITEDSIEKS